MTAGPKVHPAVLITGIVAAVFLLAVMLAAYVSMRRRADNEICGANLLLVYRAIGAGDLLDSPRWDAAPTGRAFLVRQDAWPTRQKLPMDLSCPVRNVPGDVDYRGPAASLRKLNPGDPLCADRPGNHGAGKGGNVLLKDGTIHACAEHDALWRRAAETTSD
jgi:hypothetical protein